MRPLDDGVVEASGLPAGLQVLRRGWWIILLGLVLVPAATVALSEREARSYAASAEILLNQQDVASQLANLPASSPDDAERFANTNAAIARSPRVAERAVELAALPGVTPGRLLGQSKVRPADDADLLVFTATSSSADRAVGMVNAHAAAFAEERRRLDLATIEQAREDVEERLGELRAQDQTSGAFYNRLQETEQQLATFATLQTSRASVLREASDAVDVSPSAIQRGLLGLVLGALLGVGAAFLREALDTRIHSIEEITSTLGVPLLATIGPPSRALRRERALAMVAEPHGAQADAYTFLRSSVMLLRRPNEPFAVMLTSPSVGDGKSTTAANLAVALALDGWRVALLEADLRHPSLARLLGIRSSPGVANVMRESSALHEAIRRVTVVEPSQAGQEASVDVLTAGDVLPAETPSSYAFGRVIDDLRGQYDYVIVDGPPLIGSGDALAVSARVDGVAIVCRLDRLHRRRLAEFHRLLRVVPARQLGVIVTGADPSDYAGHPYPRRGTDAGDGRRLTVRARAGTADHSTIPG